MPTLSYTPDNTPPGAIALAAQTPVNSAPVGVGLASMAGTAAAPAPVALDQAPTAIAPTALTVDQQVRTDAPPAAVAVQGVTPDATAPAALPIASTAWSNVAPTPVAIGGMTGTEATPQLVAFAPIIPLPTDSNMHTAALNFVGQLKLNQLFGFYKAPAPVAIRGVQLAAQTAPTGADVTVELVDPDGVSLGRTATLPAGKTYADVTFATPLPVLAGALVRAKVTQIGSGAAGGYLTANLVVQVVS
ncbi:hypothetical protein [Opitutus sp. ER46]|uniref:hypothetical protein n=1 Tax=Opitutus sp. ER46 TaxID=2161864 RepID=UPI000D315770|nr:hypothetical protein [Opitutus sp. ER46]PTX95768.1 hypothetical protein DB354_10175 [Opitutus sp. ER46]